jgi:hypothetical protein
MRDSAVYSAPMDVFQVDDKPLTLPEIDEVEYRAFVLMSQRDVDWYEAKQESEIQVRIEVGKFLGNPR